MGQDRVAHVLSDASLGALSTVLRGSRDRVCSNNTGHGKDLSSKEGQGPLENLSPHLEVVVWP